MPLPLWPVVRLMFGYRRPRAPILGSAFSGEVDAVGNDVARFEVGDPVFGYTGPAMGAYEIES